MQKRFSTLLVFFCLAFAGTSFAQDIKPDPALASLLRQKDVSLLQALHANNHAPWIQFTASDFFYLDEEGGVTYLDEFLKEMAPYDSKPLEIQTYKLTRAGDTAIVLHEDTDENQVRYIFTETWQRLNGDWRLRALHITNVLSDPPAIQLSQAQIDQLAGTYSNDAVTVTLRRDGSRIMYKRQGKSEIEIKAETRDVLFFPGEPRERILFQRDSSENITGYVRRYESYDSKWTRVR